ncbi:MAG: helix-turn-helix transcriptional regulator [Clostridia bacterium]|nr:helix-turn-helix transcriptional regulator [Clostridia bacterium]
MSPTASQASGTGLKDSGISISTPEIFSSRSQPITGDWIQKAHHHPSFCFGKTLRDYIEEQRIKQAIDLLLTTNDSLTQIAFQCGFSSQSYFSYVFKRRMGKTPQQYAKEVHCRYEI